MLNFLNDQKLFLAAKEESKDLKDQDTQWENLVQLLNACPQGPLQSLLEWKHVIPYIDGLKAIYFYTISTTTDHFSLLSTDANEKSEDIGIFYSLEGDSVTRRTMQKKGRHKLCSLRFSSKQ